MRYYDALIHLKNAEELHEKVFPKCIGTTKCWDSKGYYSMWAVSCTTVVLAVGFF